MQKKANVIGAPTARIRPITPILTGGSSDLEDEVIRLSNDVAKQAEAANDLIATVKKTDELVRYGFYIIIMTLIGMVITFFFELKQSWFDKHENKSGGATIIIQQPSSVQVQNPKR